MSGLLVSSRTLLDAEVAQDLGGGAVVAGVGGQPEVEVGVDGVAAAVLQLVGLQLGDQADAAALVAAQVDHDAAALLDDPRQRLVELGAAVAALRSRTRRRSGTRSARGSSTGSAVGDVAVRRARRARSRRR